MCFKFGDGAEATGAELVVDWWWRWRRSLELPSRRGIGPVVVAVTSRASRAAMEGGGGGQRWPAAGPVVFVVAPGFGISFFCFVRFFCRGPHLALGKPLPCVRAAAHGNQLFAENVFAMRGSLRVF
jgi:hypothetical protein